MSVIDVNVTLKGGLITGKKKPDKVIHARMVSNVIDSLDKRWSRPNQGRGIGAKRNILTTREAGMSIELSTTRRWPRVTGRAFQKKNIGIAKQIIPRSLRKAEREMVAELS
jgi:hypothetical protein